MLIVKHELKYFWKLRKIIFKMLINEYSDAAIFFLKQNVLVAL